jgi:hypothetical protein
MDQHPHLKQSEPATDTRASTVGVLPEPVGVLLLALVSLGILGVGTILSYSAVHLIALMGAGALAAIGVRTAVTGEDFTVALGITVLWSAALTFALTTFLVISQSQGTILPVLIASAAALGPFSILGNTIQSYGHGAGRSVLGRYVTGTIIVTASIVALIAIGVFKTTVIGLGGAVISGVVGSVGGGGVWQRVVMSVVIYTAFIYSIRKAVHNLPIETLVTPRDFDRLDHVRATVDRAHTYTKLLIIGYGIVILGVYVHIQQAGREPITRTVETLLQIPTFPFLLLLVTGLTVLLLTALLTVAATRKVSGVSGIDIVKTLTPPIVLLTVTITGTVVFGGEITQFMVTSLPGEMVQPGTFFYGLITGQPPLIILLVLPVGLLCSAFVFSIPTMVAATGTGDASLAGVASATVSLVVLVLVAILTHQSFGVIVGGVVLAAVIWEIGEYSTVAAGEIQSPNDDSPLPNGFSSLAAVHTAATTIVAIGAIAVAMLGMVVFSGIGITETTAGIALLLSSVALAAILLVLSG